MTETKDVLVGMINLSEHGRFCTNMCVEIHIKATRTQIQFFSLIDLISYNLTFHYCKKVEMY